MMGAVTSRNKRGNASILYRAFWERMRFVDELEPRKNATATMEWRYLQERRQTRIYSA